jgi:hypothetical protein
LASETHRNLLALITQLEMLSMTYQDELLASGKTIDEIGGNINVFNDQELSVLATDQFSTDYNGLINSAHLDGSLDVHFPVCQSAFVETVGIWHRTAASNTQRSLPARATQLLYAGRTPRPLINAPPCFAELLLCNWYDSTGNNDDEEVAPPLETQPNVNHAEKRRATTIPSASSRDPTDYADDDGDGDTEHQQPAAVQSRRRSWQSECGADIADNEIILRDQSANSSEINE